METTTAPSLGHIAAPLRARLVVRTVKLSELHQDLANARRHDDRNLASIAASLKTFGQVEPLVVQKSTCKVIGGNGRLEVLRRANAEECEIVEVDVNDTQAAALGIALNRTGELAGWDDEALARLLESLPDDAFDDCEILTKPPAPPLPPAAAFPALPYRGNGAPAPRPPFPPSATMRPPDMGPSLVSLTAPPGAPSMGARASPASQIVQCTVSRPSVWFSAPLPPFPPAA